MSKMDSLRALREAKYAANSARVSSSPPATAPRATAAVRPASPAERPAAAAPAGAAADELCGHRNMSGRTCTREHGHAAKSHRYG